MIDAETRFFLEDMRDYALAAQEFLAGQSLESFRTDKRTVFAVARAIEVVGEAASRIDRAFQSAHPEIPWSDIIGMRHKLAHGYRVVLELVLFETVQTHIPPLLDQLRLVLASGGDPIPENHPEARRIDDG